MGPGTVTAYSSAGHQPVAGSALERVGPRGGEGRRGEGRGGERRGGEGRGGEVRGGEVRGGEGRR